MLRLTKRLKRDIEAHSGGSIYRLNAKTADCYAFNIIKNSKGNLDFQGGWGWSRYLVDKEADYIYMLNTREFKKI